MMVMSMYHIHIVYGWNNPNKKRPGQKCTQIPPGTVLNNIVHVVRCSYVPIFTFVR